MSIDKELQDFKKEVEKLKEIDGAEEYAKRLAHLFLGNGLSLQTILLMAIDFGQQHPQWIPVEERLPDTDNCGNSDFFLVHDVADDDHVAYYNKLDNEWYTIDGNAIFVTHWMPIVPPRMTINECLLCSKSMGCPNFSYTRPYCADKYNTKTTNQITSKED